MADRLFTVGFIESQLGVDLDGDSAVGSGTAPSFVYSQGDNYKIDGTLKSISALRAAEQYLDGWHSTNFPSTAWANSSYLYDDLKDSASNLSNLNKISSAELGNVEGDLTVEDLGSSPAELSTLQAIKASFSGSNFIYYGVKGTTKDLADSRSGAYDWIDNITASGSPSVKQATITDLSMSATNTAALVSGLTSSDIFFTISGLTANSNPFIAVPAGGGALGYQSDVTPGSTTNFTPGASSYTEGNYTVTALGFANTETPTEGDLDDFNVAGRDVSDPVVLTFNFYGGEQLSHVNISGADLSTSTGYEYTQTAGSGTASVADDVWTLTLKIEAGQPAITTSVADNTNKEVLGVMVNSVSASEVGGANDYGASVFRTNAWWADIDLISEGYKFSDLCPGFGIDGTNGEQVDFDFYFTKDYLERTFSVDFDAIEGGFAGTGLDSVDADNDHEGTYIDVSKSGSVSDLRLPVTISDVTSTTAGGATDFYQVAFTNDSWSQANLSMVYGPSVNSAPSSSSSGSGGGSSSSSSTTSSTTTTTDDPPLSLPDGAPFDSVLIEPTSETQIINDDTLANKPYHLELEGGTLSTLVNNINFSQVLTSKTLDLSRTTNGGGTIASNAPDGFTSVNGCYLNSGTANDTITGSRFDDFFRGGAGDDVIDGGDGDDLIRGGAGSDELTGGDGVDKFFYTIDQLDNKADVIKDFNFDIGEKVILDTGISYTKADSNSVILSALVGGVERTVTCRFGDNVEVNDQFFVIG